MILVDVYVAGTEQKYDFWLDESAYTEDILEELKEMFVHQKAQGEFLLCDREQGRILPLEQTLEACGIHNGSSLLFL